METIHTEIDEKFIRTSKCWKGTIEEALSVKKLVEYQEIGYHMILDINMDGTFKNRSVFLAGEHNTRPQTYTTYSIIMTHESVWIDFLLEALN